MAALIIVLSVMNGFQKEVRDRMLAVISHIEVFASDGNALPDWHQTAADARRNPEVIGSAPFIAVQALIARGDEIRGAVVRGISPDEEATVTDIVAQLKGSTFSKLQPGGWGVVLGIELARELGVHAGDKVTLLAPGGQVTPAGVVPRLKQLTVVGTFDSGHYEYDSTLAMIQIDDAAKLFRLDGPTRRATAPEGSAGGARGRGAARAQHGPGGDGARLDQTNANWFSAVTLEKRMMFIVLTLIVAVAAFNLVSTLVMTVTDKRADIAILRTLGASRNR